MIRLLSKTDGKIAITLLGIVSMLLLVFIAPVTKVEAIHCTGGAVTPCTEDVKNTKHNLGANTDILAAGTTEVCIFCHTPHGARTSIGSAPSGQAPLWNRAIKTSTSYTQLYSSPNFDAVDASGETAGRPKGVSLACLSCHDGTISFDALINPPGSGGFIPGNLTDTSGSGTRMNMTFSGPGVEADGSMNAITRGQDLAGGFAAGPTSPGGQDFVYDGTGGGLGMSPYPNLTLDLRDDHPISMQMPGDAGQDPQFFDVYTNRVANVDGGGANDGTRVSYVSRWGESGRRWSVDKRDRIRLYPSVSGALSEYVECASCHNPHTPRPLFLRLPTVATAEYGTGDFTGGGFGITLVTGAGDLSHNPNQGSLVCLSCHQK